MTTTPSAAPYAFADDPTGGPACHGRLTDHLAAVLDPFTTWRLTPLITPEASCLEIAAGAGTIAVWLAERTAAVTATDLDPSRIPPHLNLRVLRHDLREDPLDPDCYQLIHVRLLLAHLPERERLVDKLVTALVPGGWLVIEEFQPAWSWCLMDAPDEYEAARLFNVYHQALTGVLAAAGNEVGWGRRAGQVMRRAGLSEVQSEFWARSWHGGQPGAMLPHDLCAQVRPKLIDAGMNADDIDAFRDLLRDPRLEMHGNLAVSARGRRPR